MLALAVIALKVTMTEVAFRKPSLAFLVAGYSPGIPLLRARDSFLAARKPKVEKISVYVSPISLTCSIFSRASAILNL